MPIDLECSRGAASGIDKSLQHPTFMATTRTLFGFHAVTARLRQHAALSAELNELFDILDAELGSLK